MTKTRHYELVTAQDSRKHVTRGNGKPLCGQAITVCGASVIYTAPAAFAEEFSIRPDACPTCMYVLAALTA